METLNHSATNPPENVHLLRRLAAILYDSFLLFSVLFVATGLFIAFFTLEPFLLPFFQIYLLMISFFYFGGFWKYGGQTLGMRAWGIEIRAAQGTVTWGQAAQRFILALISLLVFGLGFLWSLWDKQRCCWHDLASHTYLIKVQN